MTRWEDRAWLRALSRENEAGGDTENSPTWRLGAGLVSAILPLLFWFFSRR